MVSLKNGVLRITNDGKNDVAKHLFEISFVLNTITIFALYEVKAVATVTGLMMFASSMLIWVGRRKSRVIIPYNTAWYLLFIIYGCMTELWAEYIPGGILSTILKMVIILLMITSISVYVDEPEDLDRILTLFIFSVLFITVLEFSSVPPSEWFAGGMGSHFSKFNANEIAFWVVCAEMMAFYKAYIKNQRGYYILILVFLFFAILSSSRKSTATAILAPIMMLLLTGRKKSKILQLFLMIGLAVGLAYLIMTNEHLYNSVGKRFYSMSNFFSDDTVKSDGSLTMRSYFIEVAKELFGESPVFGKGMGSFIEIIGREYGLRRAYSHNNYWQILSELGITGFIIYYSFYVFVIVKLVKNVFIYKSRLGIIFLTLMILLVVVEYGMVTENGKTAQIIIAIAYTSTYVGESDGRKYKYIEKNTNKLEEQK
ncbi:MAG: O-antigen ligase family protein [Clostridia bacterium]|nr:O-antigen ligase family protein [Clostridia bacterium]